MIELVGIARWTQQVDSAPSAHECLKPVQACSLLTDKGGKDSCFVHQYEGQASVLVQSASWARRVGSTWVECSFNVGRQSTFSHFVGCQQMVNQSTPDNDCERILGAPPGTRWRSCNLSGTLLSQRPSRMYLTSVLARADEITVNEGSNPQEARPSNIVWSGRQSNSPVDPRYPSGWWYNYRQHASMTSSGR